MDQPKIISFGKIDLSSSKLKKIDPDCLLILPVKNLVAFPGSTIPIPIVRNESLKLIDYAHSNNLPFGIVCQSKDSENYPTDITEFMEIGVIGQVLHLAPSVDDTKTAIVHTIPHRKFFLKEVFITNTPGGDFLAAKVEMKRDRGVRNADDNLNMVIEALTSEFQQMEELNGNNIPELPLFSEMLNGMANIEDRVNYLCNMAPGIPEEKIKLLKCSSVADRASALLGMVYQNKQLFSVLNKIKDAAQASITENQKHNFLQHHYDALRNELFGDANDSDALRAKAELAAMPEYAKNHFDKEIIKLERFNPQSPDYSILYTYLETLCALPWSKKSSVSSNIQKAAEILDSEHFGMKDVKQRILEQLAILTKSQDIKSPILCLVGAPGVGKTSVGRSIANALGRKYQRVSLGGVHDESEIRGHRRTYLGSMPGRIISAIQKAEVNNPVLLLDEIDKLCSDIKGDPSAALLEVLDPEQNSHFHDNYIDIDFDLSDVFFIATANTLDTIPRPLLDRMEIIEMPGYLPEEKSQIARGYLVPDIRSRYKLSEEEFDLTDDAINYIIRHYTAESGVRQLEKKLAEVARKVTLNREMNPDSSAAVLSDDDIRRLLGLEMIMPDDDDIVTPVGVATGLAWTSIGGDVLQIEAALSPSKAPKLTITGNLGNVMKESATLSLQYVKSHSAALGIDPKVFDESDIHIHVPEGAVPKDGPSAGITLTSAIISLLTNRPLKPGVAMTGEMTLQGKVLPVGGIKEKILAAKRHGITDIYLCRRNRRHVEDIDSQLLNGLNFHYVDRYEDLLTAFDKTL